jgi:hypothetical protein
MIRSSRPKAAPAPKAAAPAVVIPPTINTDVDWDKFFSTKKFGNPREIELFLIPTVTDLIKAKQFRQAEYALKSFLNHNKTEGQPWMYVFVAECIKARNGTDSELKETLSFAAYLAKKSNKPEDLIRVADILVLRKFYGPVGEGRFLTNIGELVDLACEQVPTNVWPIMMSVNLATHDKDPKRMADAAEKLLSLGWPGFDERLRGDLKDQVKNLADALRAEARGAEAEALLDQLAKSEARDLYIKLTWKGDADIDLTVGEPLGATANYKNFRTVFGGAMLKNGYGSHPEEVYVCPRAFDGDYVINVEKIYFDEKNPVLEATLEVILHEGTASEQREVHKINLAKPEPIIVKIPAGVGRRKKVLPYMAPTPLPVVVKKPIEDDRDPTKPAAKDAAGTKAPGGQPR